MSKSLFTILGLLALIAAGAMYYVGKSSSHLSELKDFWWIPVPLGLLLLILGNKKKA